MVQEVADYIRGNLRQSLSVNGLAERFDITPAHLIRIFKNQFGQTVGVFIRDSRMRLTRDRLLYSDQSIKEIAWHVGIPDLQQFNKAVHKHFGIGPRELRKRKE